MSRGWHVDTSVSARSAIEIVSCSYRLHHPAAADAAPPSSPPPPLPSSLPPPSTAPEPLNPTPEVPRPASIDENHPRHPRPLVDGCLSSSSSTRLRVRCVRQRWFVWFSRIASAAVCAYPADQLK